MTIFSSINPDTKIRASAAMDNSERRSIKIDRKNSTYDYEDKAPTFDLEHCLQYIYRKPSFKYTGKLFCV
jgi:hypothetical protein